MKPSYKGKTFGGGWKGGKKPSGGGGTWTRGFERKELHDATCNKCGKPCQVPFKPNGSKPIFCRACFKRDDEGGRSSSDRPFFEDERPAAPRASQDTSGIESRLRRIEEKIDAIIEALEE